jgi:hypothetical protein
MEYYGLLGLAGLRVPGQCKRVLDGTRGDRVFYRGTRGTGTEAAQADLSARAWVGGWAWRSLAELHGASSVRSVRPVARPGACRRRRGSVLRFNSSADGCACAGTPRVLGRAGLRRSERVQADPATAVGGTAGYYREASGK